MSFFFLLLILYFMTDDWGKKKMFGFQGGLGKTGGFGRGEERHCKGRIGWKDFDSTYNAASRQLVELILVGVFLFFFCRRGIAVFG